MAKTDITLKRWLLDQLPVHLCWSLRNVRGPCPKGHECPLKTHTVEALDNDAVERYLVVHCGNCDTELPDGQKLTARQMVAQRTYR